MVAGAGMWRELAAAFCAGEGIVVGDRVRYEITRAASACGHLGMTSAGGGGGGGKTHDMAWLAAALFSKGHGGWEESAAPQRVVDEEWRGGGTRNARYVQPRIRTWPLPSYLCINSSIGRRTLIGQPSPPYLSPSPPYLPRPPASHPPSPPLPSTFPFWAVYSSTQIIIIIK